jgi:outer membrane receptor for ferrienterochelin and colicin
MCRRLLILLVPVLCVLAAPAWAQPASGDVADEAGLQFSLGNDAYRKGTFREALAHYFESNRLAPNRNVRYNIARCYEQLQQYVEAYRYYQSCVDPARPADEADSLERSLARIRPYVAILKVTTVPEGATLFLNRRDLGSWGTTPRTLAVAPGRYAVLLDRVGFRSWEKADVVLESGRETEIRADLALLQGWLSVTGDPEGAQVRVDDVTGPVVGAIPAHLALSAGEHRVVVTRDGFEPKEYTTRIEVDQTRTLQVRLAVQTGTLVVQCDESDAIILLDGRPVGFTPAVVDGVAAGPHTLTVTAEGFRPFVRRIEVEPNSRAEVEASLAVADEVAAASRMVQAVNDAPASVTLLPRSELTAFAFPTLADALRGVRGVYLTDDGTYVSTGFRGFSPFGQYGNRTLVQLDGHTLNDDWIGSSYIDYDLLTDLRGLDQIEVIRGPGSTLYGTGAFFGVLNLVTPSTPADATVSGGVATTASGSVRGQATVSHSMGPDAGFWVHGGGLYSQPADFHSPAREGSTDHPTGVARGVGDFDAETAMGRVWWKSLTLEGYFHRRDKQVQTASFDTVFGDPRTRARDTRMFVEGRFEPDLADWCRLFARVYFDHYLYEGTWSNPEPARGVAKESYSGMWSGLEARALLKPFQGAMLTVGGAWEYHFRNRERGVDATEVYLNEAHPFHAISAYALADYTPFPWMTASAGGRFDGRMADATLYSISPRAALIFRPWADGNLKLMGGRAFRAPSIYELTYWDGGHTQDKSPDLKPETIWTGEVEYTHRLPAGFWITGAGFMNRISSLIEQVGAGTDADRLRYVNRDDAVWSAGAELEVRREFRRGWMLAWQYSFQRTAEGGLGGTEVTNSPGHMSALRIVAPLSGRQVRLATRLAYQSGRKDRNGDRTRQALVWDAALTGEIPAYHLRYSAGVRNLLNWAYDHPVGDDVKDARIRQAPRTLMVELEFGY